MDDIFCKSGRYILDCLAEENPLEEILKGIPSGKIRKKQDMIRSALENGLNDTNRMLLKMLWKSLTISNPKWRS